MGIFDSGIGGLTVAKAIVKALPNEHMVYFGDTAHLPYGDKSPAAIKRYSKRIAQFLLEKKCKAVVIACNTASSHAYEAVKRECKGKALVINVIDPVVAQIARRFPNSRVGIIGTKGTIDSGVYAKKIRAAKAKVKTVSVATALLAPMVEEVHLNKQIKRDIVEAYLKHKKLQKLDALVLGCTHYPIIAPEVRNFYKGETRVIDSASVTARQLALELEGADLLHRGTRDPRYQFFVSDFTESFEKVSKRFFGNDITLRQVNLWGD